MARVITFSRFFQAYHPRKGEPTRFIERLYASIGWPDAVNPVIAKWHETDRLDALPPKHHTIRAGNRWKAGDKFSPRVWSGKPYNSKQIILAPDVEVKKVWEFEMDLNGVYSINGFYTDEGVDAMLAANDGFPDEKDLFHWLMPNYSKPKEFKGQIICWSDDVEY